MSSTASASAPATLSPDDERRLDRLFTESRGRMVRLAQALLRDGAASAEDVVAEVFARYGERLAAGEVIPGTDDTAYALQMVRNRCLDELRTAARRRTSTLDGDLVDAGQRTPDLAVVDRERVRDLMEDLATLPERQRETLLAVCLHGASHDQVAGVQAGSAQTSKSLLHRARANLRALQAARSTSCELIRLDLATARTRGVRPTELVRRHLKVCGACRAHDAGTRRDARTVRRRLGALAGGWIGQLAELIHTPAVAPLARSVAVGAATVTPLLAPADDDRGARHATTAAAHVRSAPAVTVTAAVPPLVVARREAAAAPRARSDDGPEVARRPPIAARTVYAKLGAAEALSAAERARLSEICAAMGQKGMVGPKAVTDRCPKGTLDTPQRKRRLERVEAARARDRARRQERRSKVAAPAAEKQAAADPAAAPPEPVTTPPPPASETVPAVTETPPPASPVGGASPDAPADAAPPADPYGTEAAPPPDPDGAEAAPPVVPDGPTGAR
jgi:RNA polymerase sigma factor (sigma-70 family)